MYNSNTSSVHCATATGAICDYYAQHKHTLWLGNEMSHISSFYHRDSQREPTITVLCAIVCAYEHINDADSLLRLADFEFYLQNGDNEYTQRK